MLHELPSPGSPAGSGQEAAKLDEQVDAEDLDNQVTTVSPDAATEMLDKPTDTEAVCEPADSLQNTDLPAAKKQRLSDRALVRCLASSEELWSLFPWCVYN